MDKREIVEQTNLAFGFVQRLYLETSYFIKEIEGILKQEDEEFQILKPSGYSISTLRSIGLEAANVEQWLTKKGVVFFAEKSASQVARGVTVTKFTPSLKLIVVRVALWDKDLTEPEVWAGVISNVVPKKEYSKFEYYILKFAYYDRKFFQDLGESTYEDSEWSIKLNLMKKPLYDMSTGEDIQSEIIAPVLAMYRSV